MNEPDRLVSVVMPVFNGGEFLAASIRSILDQSYPELELLLIDDASTDNSRKVIRRFRDPRIRLLVNTNHQGISTSLNRGIREAQGQWIARMDADDLSHPDRLNKQFRFLQRHPEVELVGSGGIVIDSNGRRLGRSQVVRSTGAIRLMALFHSPIIHISVMGKRERFLRQPYDPNYDGVEDYELWSRILPQCYSANLPEPLVRIRVHPQNTSQNQREQNLLRIREIRQRYLLDWGIGWNPTEEELIHRLNDSNPAKTSLSDIRRFRELLLEMEVRLSRTKTFSRAEIREVFALLWWKACFRAEPKGAELIKLYFSYPIRPGIRDSASLFAACTILKKPTRST